MIIYTFSLTLRIELISIFEEPRIRQSVEYRELNGLSNVRAQNIEVSSILSVSISGVTIIALLLYLTSYSCFSCSTAII